MITKQSDNINSICHHKNIKKTYIYGPVNVAPFLSNDFKFESNSQEPNNKHLNTS